MTKQVLVIALTVTAVALAAPGRGDARPRAVPKKTRSGRTRISTATSGARATRGNADDLGRVLGRRGRGSKRQRRLNRRQERTVRGARSKKPEQLSGEKLTIDDLMNLVEESKGYSDYLRKLTTRYKVDNMGAFYALHADRTVTPETPQVFLTIGKATVAYAPQMYTEVFWSEGQDTIHFQLVEENGTLKINAHTFAAAAQVRPSPETELTPDEVRHMHMSDLIFRTNKYADKGCKRCHMATRRRQVEPDNHGRRFVADPNWKFRNHRDRRAVLSKLNRLFGRFRDGPTKDNPIYKWFFEQESVVKRGGRILPKDTFRYKEFVREMIEKNGHEMVGDLRRLPNWDQYKHAFAAAVQGSPSVDRYLEKIGYEKGELAGEQKRVAQLHAEINLEHIRKRNNETIAWILAEGKHDDVEGNMHNEMLLLNEHAIKTIGPPILDMVVSDAEWDRLPETERAHKVRLSDLAVKNMAQLRRIVLDPKVVAHNQRRTNTYLVLMKLFNNRNKALAHISNSVLSLSAETGTEGADLLDVYADEMRNPSPSVINRRDPIDLGGLRQEGAARPQAGAQ